MAIIFVISTDLGSLSHSSRIIRPILRFFKPDISEENVYRIQYAIRKIAHMTEYGILAVLIHHALRGTWRTEFTGADLRFTLLVVLLYSASDEYHQTFTPSREGAVRDVAIDTTGATLALYLLKKKLPSISQA